MQITRPDYYKEFTALQMSVPIPAVQAGKLSLMKKA